MQGSSGVAVTKQETERAQPQGRFYSSPGAPLAWDPAGGVEPGFLDGGAAAVFGVFATPGPPGPRAGGNDRKLD